MYLLAAGGHDAHVAMLLGGEASIPISQHQCSACYLTVHPSHEKAQKEFCQNIDLPLRLSHTAPLECQQLFAGTNAILKEQVLRGGVPVKASSIVHIGLSYPYINSPD